jgi:plastocyanin
VVRIVCFLVLPVALLAPPALGAQSLLERPPNVSGDWTGAAGTLYFHFLHRFNRSGAPERKVGNVPTFLLGAGLPMRLFAGLNYSTNSTLAPRYPNEWELFGRWAPIAQDYGAPLDLGGQVGYNNAANGLDGEISAARWLGRARLLVAARALSDPLRTGHVRAAVAGGAVIRLGPFVSLAGDVGALTSRDSAERVAWSAGLHLAIPLTPHTFSLQATNTLVSTLQGISRGTSDVRYGFEFTVPITLARYFGRDRAPPATSAVQSPGPVVRTSIKNITYLQPQLDVTVGTTVEWTNRDPLPHTVTAADRSFDSGLIQPGETYRRTFTQAGSYSFFCVPHPFMKGVVVVRAP